MGPSHLCKRSMDFETELAQIHFKWSRNESATTGLCLVNYEVMGCKNAGTARTQFQIMHANYFNQFCPWVFHDSLASLVASSGKPVWAKQVGKMVKQPSISQGALKLQRNAKDGSKSIKMSLKSRMNCHCQFISATKTHHGSRFGIGLWRAKAKSHMVLFLWSNLEVLDFLPTWVYPNGSNDLRRSICFWISRWPYWVENKSYPEIEIQKNPNFQSPKLEKADVGRWTNAYLSKNPPEDAWSMFPISKRLLGFNCNL